MGDARLETWYARQALSGTRLVPDDHLNGSLALYPTMSGRLGAPALISSLGASSEHPTLKCQYREGKVPSRRHFEMGLCGGGSGVPSYRDWSERGRIREVFSNVSRELHLDERGWMRRSVLV